jgi:serine/threonine protein kinase
MSFVQNFSSEFHFGISVRSFISEFQSFEFQICDFSVSDVTAAGMRYLIENDIVHRDLKPQNILLSENSDNAILKIADFGMARKLPANQLSTSFLGIQTWIKFWNFKKLILIGSPEYQAPEILNRKPYSSKCDLWSLGWFVQSSKIRSCSLLSIFYEILTGSSPCTQLKIKSRAQWQNKVTLLDRTVTTYLPHSTISNLYWDLIV